MNIGLLVSEIEDKEVKRICIGACQAAKDKNVTLVILPGKHLCADISEDNPYDYQQAAIFDYACGDDFDALIVDIERIGKKIPILKKEAFLKKLNKKPMLTLSKQEGFVSVNDVKEEQNSFEQLGYEAVCDAVYYAENKELPLPQKAQDFVFNQKTEVEALHLLSKIGHSTLHRKFPYETAYQAFSEFARNEGVSCCGIMLYDQKVRNTIKYWWKMPETIVAKGLMVDGKRLDINSENSVIQTRNILSLFVSDKPKNLIVGDIYVGEHQIGILISEVTDVFFTDYFFDSLISTITCFSRVSYLEKELEKTNEELYEVQEELARDDSVLDHIGDQDYLTGGLNRRGFFAKAYDFLKDNFKPGKYAIVAYIHMESLKGINEMFGHEEGDRAVKRVAGILEEVFEGSIYGRIRGNEFAVLEITDDEDKADSIREEMSQQNAKLLYDTKRYMNHLQYSICEFGYDENLSLRDMLKETDDNLQRLRANM